MICIYSLSERVLSIDLSKDSALAECVKGNNATAVVYSIFDFSSQKKFQNYEKYAGKPELKGYARGRRTKRRVEYTCEIRTGDRRALGVDEGIGVSVLRSTFSFSSAPPQVCLSSYARDVCPCRRCRRAPSCTGCPVRTSPR